ncbi:zinc finger BED domain-containing protein RICESLEEPER 2-like [Fagus crenata]
MGGEQNKDVPSNLGGIGGEQNENVASDLGIALMNVEVDEFGESASSVSKKLDVGLLRYGDNESTSLLRHAKKCSKKVNDGDEIVDRHRPIDQDMYREMVALAIIMHNCPFSYAEH